MRNKSVGVALLCGLLLAACGSSGTADTSAAAPPQAAAPASQRTVWEAMNQSLIPASSSVWELAGNLSDDSGKLDPARLTGEQWKMLEAAATSLKEGGSELVAMNAPRVAPAGTKILNEGLPGALTAAQVQAAIDANVAGFRSAAQKFLVASDELAAAAVARDAEKVDALSNGLTDVCGECHTAFWTPPQAQ